MFAEDLSPLFADFGESVTVAGVSARGIFDVSTDVAIGDMLSTAPALEVPSTVTAAEGNTVVIRSVSYKIRQVLDQPPDGATRLLVLSRA